MYQKFIVTFIFMIVLILSGCSDGGGGIVPLDTTSNNTTTKGSAAKGPFVKGSVIKAYKLEENGTRSTAYEPISSKTVDDLGKFSILNIGWSGPTELEISGKYFDENTASISLAAVTLSAIVDVKAGEDITANINVLTDLAAQRTKALMALGSSIDEAKKEAKKSVVELFNIDLPSDVELEALDITDGSSKNAKANAELLRISAAVSKSPQLLESIKEAIVDGNITNDTQGAIALSTLAKEIKDINISKVSQNLQSTLAISDPPSEDDIPDSGGVKDMNAYIPVISDIPTIHKMEDDPAFEISVSVEDNDTNPAYNDAKIIKAVSSDTSIATVSLEGDLLKITPVSNAHGLVSITLTASDGTYQSSKSFDIDIAPVNDAPVLDDLANKTEVYKRAFSISLSASDIDGDTLVYSASSSNPTVATVLVADNNITVTPLSVGEATINATVTDGQQSVTKSMTLTVIPKPITIKADPKVKTYGDMDPVLTYRITLGSLEAGDSLSGTLQRSAGESVGSYAITLGTLFNPNYDITFEGSELNITKAPLTAIVNDATKIYGDQNPTFSAVFSGFKSGDDSSVVTAIFQTQANDTSPVGSYDINISTFTSTNYELNSTIPGTLSIIPRDITVKADPKTKVYGDADPALTYQVTAGSLVANDILSGSLQRALGESVGSYTITQGTLANQNYNITFITNELNITKATLTATINDATREYADPNPPFSAVFSGFKNGEDSSVLSVTYTTDANLSSPAGDYPIQISGFLADNYELGSVTNGTLTVTKAPLLIAGNTYQKFLGDNDPTFSATFLGLKNNDPSSKLGNLIFSTMATTAFDEGVYDINISGIATSQEYNITLKKGLIRVKPATEHIVKDLDSFSVINYGSTMNEVMPNSLYRDANGTIHTAFVNNYDLYYAYSTDEGETWTTQNIGSPKNGKIKNAGLAVDSQGTVYIAYTSNPYYSDYASGGGDNYTYLKYTLNAAIKPQGGEWTFEEVAGLTGRNNGYYFSNIYVDDNDDVYVVATLQGWYQYGGEASEFKRVGTNSWSKTTIVNFTDQPLDTVLLGYSSILQHQDGSTTIVMSRPIKSSSYAPAEYRIWYKTKPLGGSWGDITQISAGQYADRFDAFLDENGKIQLFYVKIYEDTAHFGIYTIEDLLNSSESKLITKESISSSNVRSLAALRDKKGFTHIVFQANYRAYILTYDGNTASSKADLVSAGADFAPSKMRSRYMSEYNAITCSATFHPNKLYFIKLSPKSTPTIANLEINNLSEGVSDATTIGNISVLNSGESAITGFTLSGTGSQNFDIDANGVITVANGANLDFETTQEYNLFVTAVNSQGISNVALLHIVLENINDNAPTFLAGDTQSIDISENNTSVTVVRASDLDGDSLSFSISGGSDSDKFSIDSSTGELNFVQAPDYEDPQDSDTDNTYVVDINVTDGTYAATQTIMVNVRDISEAQAVDPYIVGSRFWADINANGNIDENETSTLSDKNGYFSFPVMIPDGTSVVMIERGLHNGKVFDGNLSAVFSNTKHIISPITSLGSVGFSDDEIIDALTQNGLNDTEFAAAITSQELYLDPFDSSLLPLDGNMSGFSDDAIQKFRRVLMANVAINSALTMQNGYGMDKGNIQSVFFDDPDGSGDALSPLGMMIQAGKEALSVEALKTGHARVMARIYVTISDYIREKIAAVWGDDALVAQTLQTEMANIPTIVNSLVQAYQKAYGYGMVDPKFGWVYVDQEYAPMLFIQADELGFSDVSIVYDDGDGNDQNITFAVNAHNYLEEDSVEGSWMVEDGKVLTSNSKEYRLLGDTIMINGQTFQVKKVYYHLDDFKPATTYTGSANPGDFVNFSIDGSLLNYEVAGAVYGNFQGSLTLQDATGNGVFFFADIGGGEYVKVAKSDNLGIFIAPVDSEGNTTVMLGLQVAQTALNESDIVNKAYIYAELGEDSEGTRYVDGYIVALNSDHSISLYPASGGSLDGCWKILGNHVVVKVDASSSYCSDDYAYLDDTTADVRVVIKPSQQGARAGFIADSVDGEYIGIGLEQRAITMSEMNGSYDAYWYDFTNDSETFVQVDVTNDGESASYTLTPYVCDANGCQLDSDSSHQLSGSIEINKLCSGDALDGVMCVDNSFIGFIDPSSGYFMLSNDSSLIFGSKQLP